MSLTKPKGTYDVLPNDAIKWIALEEHIRNLCDFYGFGEIRTPIFEYYSVFHRENETSDMVTKETYNFQDKSDRKLTLRPEQTAGIIRSYVENKLYATEDISKFYYMGPNFRYERPQKGRTRQFSQFGVELIGSNDVLSDVEVITLAYETINSLGLKNVVVKINSLGNEQSRKQYQEALIKYFEPLYDELSDDSKQRINKNPLRILDSKDQKDIRFFDNAPIIYDYLDSESKERFDKIIKLLAQENVNVQIDNRLVRGLDYYSHTVFEIQAQIKDFGAQNTLGGGGRYQDLVKELGGPDIPGIGFGFGLDRLLIALECENIDLSKVSNPECYLLYFDEESKDYAFKILNDLRKNNIKSLMSYSNKQFKTQLKGALRENPKYLIIIGSDEVTNNLVTIKNVKTQTQESIKKDELIKYLKGIN